MIPFILAAVGGYLIGDAYKQQVFAEGGVLKGSNPKTGETYGVVVGSQKVSPAAVVSTASTLCAATK